MAVDAMLAVKSINNKGEVKYPVKAVNILKSHGKSATESMFINGYAINCTVASQGTHFLPPLSLSSQSTISSLLSISIARLFCFTSELLTL
jgi:chaperonin GroEL (HSP60 family)